MKIGIITIWQINNYGAELQAFALQRKLNDMGFDCENIDYPFYKNPDHSQCRLSRPVFDLGWKNSLKEKLFPLKQRFLALVHLEEERERQSKFREFHRNHTKHSASRYRSMSALYEATLGYDVFMVGSDQVWNPRCGTSLQPYFLTFAPQGARKISYASSFGVSELPPETISQYAKWLNGFDCISVREKTAVALVERITGRKAMHAL
ncbi:MAG: polysaccharide pyruvyl transferase family protein, partial [Deltaproteobacteria bacterium]|nr:polysaccharide pyruvyl transferase family protein [Deltaproteobacteria bacterium]